MKHVPSPPLQTGFTLIELSIVLVIIGLVAGGIIVGRDMIAAAVIRGQISQLDKYNVAVKTFAIKYSCLPGDCANAAAFGFRARGPYPGEGDGNGRLGAVWQNTATGEYDTGEGGGENGLFWVDLSNAKLIDEKFSSATATTVLGVTSESQIHLYMPYAKLGQNNYVYTIGSYYNNFGISHVTGVSDVCPACIDSVPGASVLQAFSIDQKIDDGFPQTGSIIARYNDANGGWIWAGTKGTGATVASASTCYDNGNVAGARQQYTMSFTGTGLNCGITQRFP